MEAHRPACGGQTGVQLVAFIESSQQYLCSPPRSEPDSLLSGERSGVKPDVSYVRTYRCLTWVHVPDDLMRTVESQKAYKFFGSRKTVSL